MSEKEFGGEPPTQLPIETASLTLRAFVRMAALNWRRSTSCGPIASIRAAPRQFFLGTSWNARQSLAARADADRTLPRTRPPSGQLVSDPILD